MKFEIPRRGAVLSLCALALVSGGAFANATPATRSAPDHDANLAIDATTAPAAGTLLIEATGLVDAARAEKSSPAPATMSAAEANAAEAVAALRGKVKNTSRPDALERAFTAYFNYRSAHPERVTKPYFYFVDLGLDNRTPRGYVFDMDALEVVEGPFTVAHGSGSSKSRNGVPTRFSNQSGSHASSLGLYLAQETYTFRGKMSGRAYSSVGLRMSGESGEFNDAARARGIVAHGAPYVTSGDAGRSEGCPAMELSRANRLLPKIANGGVVFIYSPADAAWLDEDPWLNAE